MTEGTEHRETKGKAFFEEDTPHGLVKRFMYGRYLQAYIPITQYSNFTTVILDGFAGAGRYGKNWPEEIEKYGSPLIAIRASVQHCITRENQRRKGTELKEMENRFQPTEESEEAREYADSVCPCRSERVTLNLDSIMSSIILIFVEKDEGYFRQLIRNILNTFHFYGIHVQKEEYEAIRGQYMIKPSDQTVFSISCIVVNSTFDKIEAPTRENPSTRYLTIIDPFGYSHTPMCSVAKFVGPSREVYINFMSSYVNRFVSKNPQAVASLYGLDLPLEKDKDAVAAFVENSVRKDNEEYSGDDLNKCVNNYENALKSAARTEFALTFEMRGESNARLYHLIFITNHMKGIQEMKKTMIRGTQEQGQLSLSDYKILRKGFQLSLDNNQKDGVVAEAIFSRFRGKAKICIDEVKDFILLDTPYIFSKGALKILEKEENPRLIGIAGELPNQRRKRCTYPDHTEWFLSFSN